MEADSSQTEKKSMHAVEILSELRLMLAEVDPDLIPSKHYTYEELADVWGIEYDTVTKIPEAELPRVRIGPRRGATRIVGIDAMRYARGLPPIDYSKRLRDQEPKTPARVVPMNSKSKTQIL